MQNNVFFFNSINIPFLYSQCVLFVFFFVFVFVLEGGGVSATPNRSKIEYFKHISMYSIFHCFAFCVSLTVFHKFPSLSYFNSCRLLLIVFYVFIVCKLLLFFFKPGIHNCNKKNVLRAVNERQSMGGRF